jgi:hypothetical protein
VGAVDLVDEVDRTHVAELVPIEGESRPNLERHLDSLTIHLLRVAEAFAGTHLATAPAPRAFGLSGRGTR